MLVHYFYINHNVENDIVKCKKIKNVSVSYKTTINRKPEKN